MKLQLQVHGGKQWKRRLNNKYKRLANKVRLEAKNAK